MTNTASTAATPNWSVASQREAPIMLANGDWVDGVVITILAGPNQVPLTTGIRNELYTDQTFVQQRLQTVYEQWLNIQNLTG